MMWGSRDGCAKVFQKPLDLKKSEKNRARGISIASALPTSRNNEVGSAPAEMPTPHACGACTGLKRRLSSNPFVAGAFLGHWPHVHSCFPAAIMEMFTFAAHL